MVNLHVLILKIVPNVGFLFIQSLILSIRLATIANNARIQEQIWFCDPYGNADDVLVCFLWIVGTK